MPLSFDLELGEEGEGAYRVEIYVNGWQFGRFVSTHGPQTSYPVPQGVLDHYGQNEVLVMFWALGRSSLYCAYILFNSHGSDDRRERCYDKEV